MAAKRKKKKGKRKKDTVIVNIRVDNPAFERLQSRPA